MLSACSSRVTTSTNGALSFTVARGSGAFTAKAVVGKTALTKGKTYVVTLVATAADGRKSTLASASWPERTD